MGSDELDDLAPPTGPPAAHLAPPRPITAPPAWTPPPAAVPPAWTPPPGAVPPAWTPPPAAPPPATPTTWGQPAPRPTSGWASPPPIWTPPDPSAPVVRPPVVVRQRRPRWIVPVVAVVVLAPLGWFAASYLADDDPDKDRAGAAKTTTTVPVTIPPTPIDGGLLVYEDGFDDTGSGWVPSDNAPLADGVTMVYDASLLRFSSPAAGARFDTPFHTLPTAAGIVATVSPDAVGTGGFGPMALCEYRTSSAREQVRLFVASFDSYGEVNVHTSESGFGADFRLAGSNQVGEPLGARTTPLELALSCVRDGERLIIESYVDGVLAVSTELVVPFTGRWATGVGIAGNGSATSLGFEKVEVHDLTRPAVDDPPDPPEADEGSAQILDFERRGRRVADEPGEGEFGLAPGGLVFRPRSISLTSFLTGAERADGVAVTSTFATSEGAPATSAGGVACVAYGSGDFGWAYTILVDRNGRWIIEREDKSTGITLFFPIKVGSSPDIASGPITATLSCSLDPSQGDDGPALVRVVASVGGHEVADVFDAVPAPLDSWATGVLTGMTDDGPFDVTFLDAEIRMIDE